MTKTKTRAVRWPALAALFMALLAMALAGFYPGLSAAAASETTADIGYYVRAVLPENQIDDTLTYFDLRVKPDTAQTLEVEVVNETDKAITVDMDAISASTNRNGIIDYKTPDIRDRTLKIPFSDITELENKRLTVPANGTACARATVTLPESAYDGTVLGGLVFTRQNGEDAAAGEGMTLHNVYSYVLGVKLTETDAAVAPDFELAGVAVETVNYEPAFVHYIRNKEAAIAKGVDLHIVVRDEKGNPAGECIRRWIDMAPNSVMPLGVTPAGENNELTPGCYTSAVTLEYEGKTWSFEETFTVGRVEAEKLNTALSTEATSAPSSMLIAVLAFAVAMLLAMFIIILVLLKRIKEKDKTAKKL